MAFKLASSPHLSTKAQTRGLMFKVMLCALPGALAQCYFFGWGTLIQIALAIAIAVATEAAVLKLRARPVGKTDRKSVV